MVLGPLETGDDSNVSSSERLKTLSPDASHLKVAGVMRIVLISA